ncbi:MAG: protein-disulfide reductase DsbD N-terminal domain-containing protein [Panacagrimonas sp.]
MRLTVASLMLCLAPSLHAGFLSDKATDDSGILPVEQAFVVQPAIWDQGRLLVGVDIAPGCYLYKSKLSVEAIEPVGSVLGRMNLPEGASHRDEHFGTVEIYRGSVQAAFQPARNIAPTRLRVRLQGCAEDKVCYPMQTRIVDVLPQ